MHQDNTDYPFSGKRGQTLGTDDQNVRTPSMVRMIFAWFVRSVAGAALIMGGVFGWMSWEYGSLSWALAHFRGEDLLVLPASLDIGSARANETRECHFDIRNLGNRPIRIVGVRTDCDCMVVSSDFPYEIAAKGSLSLPVRILFSGTNDAFKHQIEVISDLAHHGIVAALITGRIEHDESRSE